MSYLASLTRKDGQYRRVCKYCNDVTTTHRGYHRHIMQNHYQMKQTVMKVAPLPVDISTNREDQQSIPPITFDNLVDELLFPSCSEPVEVKTSALSPIHSTHLDQINEDAMTECEGVLGDFEMASQKDDLLQKKKADLVNVADLVGNIVNIEIDDDETKVYQQYQM